jgi:hypothetical protein
MLPSVKEVKTTCDIITRNNNQVFVVELKPPTNINITTSGNNVTVTWTLPGESETYTYLAFHSSGRREIDDYIRAHTYIALLLSIISICISLLLH